MQVIIYFHQCVLQVNILDRKEIFLTLSVQDWLLKENSVNMVDREAGKAWSFPEAALSPCCTYELELPPFSQRILFLKDKLHFLLPIHRHIFQCLSCSLLTLSFPQAHQFPVSMGASKRNGRRKHSAKRKHQPSRIFNIDLEPTLIWFKSWLNNKQETKDWGKEKSD